MSQTLYDILPREVIDDLLESFREAFGVPGRYHTTLKGVFERLNRSKLCLGQDDERCPSSCPSQFFKKTEDLSDAPYVLYTCPNGLTDLLIPISVEGISMGIFSFGQMMVGNGRLPSLEALRHHSHLEGKAFDDALSSIPHISRSKTESLASSFSSSVTLLARLGSENIHRRDAESRLRAVGQELEDRVNERTAELQKSEARLKDAQHIARIGSLEHDMRTERSWWSEELYHLLGYDPEHDVASRQNFERRIHPDDLAGYRESRDRELERKDYHEFELRVTPNPNALLYVYGQIRIERDASGKPIFLRGAIRDITSRVAAEKALKETNRLHSLILENSIVGISLVRKGRFEWVNPRLAAMTGYDMKELAGASTRLIFREDDQYEEIDRNAYRVLRRGQRFDAVLSFRRKDGSPLWCRFVCSAINDKQVHEEGVVWIFDDISEQRRSDHEAMRQRAILHTVINALPDRIFFKDTEGRFIGCNEAFAKQAGVTPNSIRGKSASDIFGPSRGRDLEALDHEVLKTLSTSIKEERSEQDGEASVFETLRVPVVEIGGRVSGIAGVSRDITRRKHTEAVLRESEERFRAVFSHAGVGICMLDTNGRFVRVNPFLCDFLGFPEVTLVGMQFANVLVPEVANEVIHHLEDLHRQQIRFRKEVRFVHSNGEHVWGNVTASLIRPPGSHPLAIAVVEDINRSKQLEMALRRMATTDTLTGASNRMRFMEQAETEMARFNRYGTPVSFMMLDIDHFKKVNDTYGHQAGDEVLRQLAEICQNAIRSNDCFARYGGEEFAFCLAGTDKDRAAEVAERIRTTLEETVVETPTGSIRFTVSIGVTQLRKDDSIEMVLARADDRLYAAKHQGRNQVVANEP